jgi:DNA-binding transcriptional ArsR family regulator
MTHDDAAACLEALGHPLRLTIWRLLVRAGPAGLPAGEVQARTGLAASTLSHHLKVLARVGLVGRRRAGTVLACRAEFGVMQGLVDYLSAECCAEAAGGAAGGADGGAAGGADGGAAGGADGGASGGAAGGAAP